MSTLQSELYNLTVDVFGGERQESQDDDLQLRYKEFIVPTLSMQEI